MLACSPPPETMPTGGSRNSPANMNSKRSSGKATTFVIAPAPELIASNPSPLMQIAAATVGTKIVPQSTHLLAKELTHEPSANGRLELLHYLHEQSISETTHRHGRVSLQSQSL